jgi:hypothetical protein
MYNSLKNKHQAFNSILLGTTVNSRDTDYLYLMAETGHVSTLPLTKEGAIKMSSPRDD